MDPRGVGVDSNPMEDVGDEGARPDDVDESDNTDDDNTGSDTDSGESSYENINV